MALKLVSTLIYLQSFSKILNLAAYFSGDRIMERKFISMQRKLRELEDYIQMQKISHFTNN